MMSSREERCGMKQIVIGLMSEISMDGIDAAMVEVKRRE